ncbi:MAG TPA: 50S ribosomal protein L20, partial [Candidatus Dojkabacteria bacterium]|nr:50S ribosomal protein L20 [Candidatus Dojkabacteria bacterium]
LKKKNIELNRKVLSDIAVNEPEVFSFIIKSI